jgi:hypothetical protein
MTIPAMRGLLNAPWPFVFDGLVLSNNTANADGTATLTTGVTTHTKTAWTQLFASTARRSGLLSLHVQQTNVSGANNSTLIEIATGAAGSETAILSDLAVGGASAVGGAGANVGTSLFVPVQIAAGSRVSVRGQTAVASRNVTVHMALFDLRSAAILPTSVDVIGTSTATSAGTVMSGASGTWVQITASTSQLYRAILLIPSVGSTAITTASTDMDVGVGAAGSEVVIGTVPMRFWSSEQATNPIESPYLPMAYQIPAGSRLAVRHRLASNPGGAAVCLVGIPG